jgi:hypothetical protein
MNKTYIILLSSLIACTSSFLSHAMNEDALSKAQEIEKSIKQRIDSSEFNTYGSIRDTIIKNIDNVPRGRFYNAVRDAFFSLFKDAVPAIELNHEANVQVLHCSNTGDQDPTIYAAIDGGIVAVWKRNHEQQWYRVNTIDIDRSLFVKCIDPLTDRRLAIGANNSKNNNESFLFLYNQKRENGNFVWELQRTIRVGGEIELCAFTDDESRCAVSVHVKDIRNHMIKIFEKNDNRGDYTLGKEVGLNYPVTQLRWNGGYALEMGDAFGCKRLENMRGRWFFMSSTRQLGAVRPGDIKWTGKIEGSNVIVEYPTPLLSSVVHYLLAQENIKKEEAKREREFPPLSTVRATQIIEKTIVEPARVVARQQSPTADLPLSPHASPTLFYATLQNNLAEQLQKNIASDTQAAVQSEQEGESSLQGQMKQKDIAHDDGEDGLDDDLMQAMVNCLFDDKD